MKQENIISEEKVQKRLNGFTMVPNFVIDLGHFAKLKQNASKVYLVICSHAHYDTRVCSPNRETLALKAGIELGGFFRAREELVNAGLIKTWRHKINSTWHYKVIMTEKEREEELGKVWTKSIGNKSKKGNIRSKSIQRDSKGKFTGRNQSILADPINSTINHQRTESTTKENTIISKYNSNGGSDSACLNSQSSPLKIGLVMKDQEQIKALVKDKDFNEAMEVLCGPVGGLTHSEAYNTMLDLRAA